jgi:hypothetical protein
MTLIPATENRIEAAFAMAADVAEVDAGLLPVVVGPDGVAVADREVAVLVVELVVELVDVVEFKAAQILAGRAPKADEKEMGLANMFSDRLAGVRNRRKGTHSASLSACKSRSAVANKRE